MRPAWSSSMPSPSRLFGKCPLTQKWQWKGCSTVPMEVQCLCTWWPSQTISTMVSLVFLGSCNAGRLLVMQQTTGLCRRVRDHRRHWLWCYWGAIWRRHAVHATGFAHRVRSAAGHGDCWFKQPEDPPVEAGAAAGQKATVHAKVESPQM